jgi:hypothetical protein
MGTFTLKYCVKTWFQNYKWNIPVTIVGCYFGKLSFFSLNILSVNFVKNLGYCWDQAGYDKILMMKGQSRMFKHVVENPHVKDVWNY